MELICWFIHLFFTHRSNQTLFTLHLDTSYMLCVPKQDYNHLFVVSTFLIFVIPMSIITILYILIGLQLRRSKIVHRASPSCNNVRLTVSLIEYTPTPTHKVEYLISNKHKNVSKFLLRSHHLTRVLLYVENILYT